MNEDERIKFMQYEIETKIKEVKEKYQAFAIYLPYGHIIADDYRFGVVIKDDIDLYRNGKYIATIKIWSIIDIE